MRQVSENPVKNREDSFTALIIVSGLLITLYLTSNIMAVKLISVFSITWFDAGTILFPFTYMLGDILTEVWGFKTARKVIFLTFFCNIILVFGTFVGALLPYPEYIEETAKAYSIIFAYVPRIVVASLIAFLGGELLNAWAMVKIKNITGERFLWIRTIGSSVLGHAFDTSIFVLIAFAGTAPVPDLIFMIVVQYFAKLAIEAFAATPMVYASVSYLKRVV